MTLITQKAFARKIKRTPQYVNKLVAQGVIRLKNGKVDPKQAAAAIKGSRQRVRSVSTQRKGSNAHGGGRPAGSSREKTSGRSDTQNLTSARAKETGYKAELARLEFEKASGTLLPKEQVLEAERRKNANIRTTLRSLRRSLAPFLATISDVARMEEELGEAFDRLLLSWSIDPFGETAPLPAPAPPPEVQTSAAAAGGAQ